MVGVGDAFAAAGAQPIARQRRRQARRCGRLSTLERPGHPGGQRLPDGIVLLERLGAWRRVAPLVFLRRRHAAAGLRISARQAVDQIARVLQFLIELALQVGGAAALLTAGAALLQIAHLPFEAGDAFAGVAQGVEITAQLRGRGLLVAPGAAGVGRADRARDAIECVGRLLLRLRRRPLRLTITQLPRAVAHARGELLRGQGACGLDGRGQRFGRPLQRVEAIGQLILVTGEPAPCVGGAAPFPIELSGLAGNAALLLGDLLRLELQIAERALLGVGSPALHL